MSVLLVVLLVVMMTLTMRIIALIVIVVMVFVVMFVLVMLFLILIVMVVMAMAVGIVTLVLVVMMVVKVSSQACKLFFDGVATLHSGEELRTVKIIPRSGYDGCGGILFAKERYGFGDLFVGCTLRVRKNDTACIFDLVVEELTEILHIHLAFFNVGNRGKAVEENVLGIQILNRADNIRKLANP